MKFIKLLLLPVLMLLLFMSNPVRAQVVIEEDEFDAPADTAEFYKKLYNYSRDRKFLYIVYKSIFNPPARAKSKKKSKPVVAGLTANKYKNKIIREVIIKTYEPFGTSLSDTSRVPHSIVQKGGNSLHALSKRATIRNLLLFRKNEKADPLKLTESERLLRSTGFIRDARIVVRKVPGSKDSVDIEVSTQDYWSIRPDLTASTSKVRYRGTDNNFLGFGHRLDVRATDRIREDSPIILDASYRVPTIRNTYISPEIYYGNSKDNNVRGLRISRPFYSPLTKVAGGLDIISLSESDSIQVQNDTNYYSYSFRSLVWDGWLGKSWQIRKGTTDEERSTKLVTALRYARTRYPFLNREDTALNDNFSATDLYMASISLSSRKYLKDRYIFKFGEYEDVPDGRKLTLTSGYEKTTLQERYYISAEGAFGTYFYNWGYFYFNLGYGTYFNAKEFSQGIISSSAIYFTPLKQIGRWRYRQFTTINFDYGIDRNYGERIYLNATDGLPGYKNEYPQGTSRFSISTQIVLYSPYELLGFRFAPILLVGAGMVGSYNQSPFHSKLYQSYGLGFLIKNELLVFNTFQITVAWYPVLPDAGSDIRFNPVKLRQDRFPDFDISRPGITPFQ